MSWRGHARTFPLHKLRGFHSHRIQFGEKKRMGESHVQCGLRSEVVQALEEGHLTCECFAQY